MVGFLSKCDFWNQRGRLTLERHQTHFFKFRNF